MSACTASGAAVETTCVQVTDGPTTGPHSGDPKYVEVYVSKVHPTYFMKILGTTTEVVTARAVATNISGGPNSGCLYTLGPPSKTGIEGVNVTGSASLIATNCSILDNGDYDPNDPAVNVQACSFGVAGTDTGKGQFVTCNGAAKPPTYGIPSVANPLATLTPPTQPAASLSCPSKGTCDISTKGTETLQPGTYSSIDFGKNSTTTLNPGIYYIDGSAGVTFEGKATVTGNGVMFYFTNGATTNAVGGGNVPDLQLTAPSASTCPSCPSQYDGILFYQDPTDTNAPSLGGDNNTTLNGVLYFPTVELSFFGNDSFTAGIVVALAVSLTGSPTVTLNGTAGLPPGVSTISVATLVE